MLDSVFSYIETASADELEQVIARALHRKEALSNPQKAAPADTRAEDFVCSCFHERLLSAGFGELFVSVSVLKKASLYKQFKEGCDRLFKLVDNYVKPVNDTERFRAVRIIVDIVLDYIMGLNCVLSARFVVNNFLLVRSIVEQAFPGYCQSGALHLILNRSILSKQGR
jgi:hypothetical protein